MPAIVVLAYERPDALRRLLGSLAAAFYPPGVEVPLVISLDRAESVEGRETLAVANAFEWSHGLKTVVERDQHLGVVRHFRAAGELVREYGALVLLEDDLTVAPPFYDFASRMIDAYGSDDRVAGCCLYALWFNGLTLEPFTPIEDGNDVFFLGVPHTQGLCFTAGQWTGIEAWLDAGAPRPHPKLHAEFLRFGPDEWLPSLAAYLAETGRFFCFPRVSLTVGWGDAGTHFDKRTSWFQTPIQLGGRGYALPSLDDAFAVYDGFFELLPDRLERLAPAFAGREFDMDLNATKQPANLVTRQVITTRPVHAALQRYGLAMYPPELNIVCGVPGDDIALARRDEVAWDAWSESDAQRRLHDYAWRHHRPSRRRTLRFGIAGLIARLRRWLGR